MRFLPWLLLLAGCSPFGTTEGDDAGASPPTKDGGADAEADARSPDGGDGGVAREQRCNSVGASACTCAPGNTCVIHCQSLPVKCQQGSDCTLSGVHCDIDCDGAGTICRTAGCTQCQCHEKNGGLCQ